MKNWFLTNRTFGKYGVNICKQEEKKKMLFSSVQLRVKGDRMELYQRHEWASWQTLDGLYYLFIPREHLWYKQSQELPFAEHLLHVMCFPGGASGKELACWCRSGERCGFNPWVEKIPRSIPCPGGVHGQRIPGGLQSTGLQRVGHDRIDVALNTMYHTP